MSDVLYNKSLFNELLSFNDNLLKCHKEGSFDIFEFINDEFYNELEKAEYIKHYNVKINYNFLIMIK